MTRPCAPGHPTKRSYGIRNEPCTRQYSFRDTSDYIGRVAERHRNKLGDEMRICGQATVADAFQLPNVKPEDVFDPAYLPDAAIRKLP